MNANVPAPPDANTPGLAEYVGVLKKRRRLALLIGAPILGLAMLLAVVLPDVYRAQGNIEIEGAQTLQALTAARAPAKNDGPYADQYVQSLSTAVLSDRNLARLLAEHQLYEDQKDDPSGSLSRLRSDIDVDIVTVPILDPETGREREIVTAFTVAYENGEPQRAQAGAQWLVNAYMEENRRDREAQASSAARFFAGEAERMRTHVADLETKLAAFKSRNAGALPELAQSNLNAVDRTERDIQDVESQMQALRRERVFLQAQLRQARSTVPGGSNVSQLEAEYARKSAQYDPSHPDMVSLRRQIEMARAGGSSGASLKAQLQNQRAVLAEVRERYSADHPDVRRIQRNIDSLQARIAAGETVDVSSQVDSPMVMQVQTQLNSTDIQLGALQERSLELRSRLAQLEGRLTTAPEVEREFQTVSRDLASARAKYEELLKRQMDAEVEEAAIAGGTADKFRVKSRPTIPEEPAKPARLLIFIIGLVLSTVAALTAVLFAQMFDQTVRGARDIRDILDVSPLVAVPIIERPGKGTAFGRA